MPTTPRPPIDMSGYVTPFASGTINYQELWQVYTDSGQTPSQSNQRAVDKTELKTFLSTGKPKIASVENGILYGAVRRGGWLFSLSPHTLTVKKKGYSHLLPQFRKLAEREGVELVLTDEDIITTESRSIRYFAFKNLDDKWLLDAKLRDMREPDGNLVRECDEPDCTACPMIEDVPF